jgi:hypothetical protein
MAVDPPSDADRVTLTLRDHLYDAGPGSASPHKIITKTFEGFQMRFDHWGRIVIDKCNTDQEHILHPIDHDGMRSKCRHLLEQLVPEEFMHQIGDITIAIQFTPKKEIP